MASVALLAIKHIVQRNVVDGSTMIGFPHVKADSELLMPGIEPGPLVSQVRYLSGIIWRSRNENSLKTNK